MKQHDLFENEDALFLQEAEEFLSEMELQVEKLEEQEQFFEENQAFNWAAEFPQICDENGKFEGFDVVLGNPPYIYSRNKNFNKSLKKYFGDNYELSSNQINTSNLFIEKAIQLANNTGTISFIVPNNLLTINSLSKVRKYIIENFGNLIIINILDKIFEQANVDACIIEFSKNRNNKLVLSEMQAGKIIFRKEINKQEIKSPNYIFQISLYKNEKFKNIIDKIETKSVVLKRLAKVSTGIKVYQIGKGKPEQTEIIKKNREFHSREKNKNYSKYLHGADVDRYLLKWSGEYLKYGIWIAEMRKSVPFVGERILIRQIPNKLPYCIKASYTNEHFYNDINSMVIFNSNKYDLKYILAILNSKLISFWFANKLDKLQRNIFPQFKVNELANFPIFNIDINNQIYKELIKLVDNIYNNKKFDTNNNKIDQLVYKLYNLTKSEITNIETC